MHLDYMQRHLKRVIYFIAQILFFLFFVRFFVLELDKVNGISMYPTLDDRQIFFVSKIHYLFRAPHRFEIVQLQHPQQNDLLLVKRVIGLPGETLIFRENRIIIRTQDGSEEILSEPYLTQDSMNSVPFGFPRTIEIPDHSYFVIGDNRQASTDSRIFGSVHRKFILGKAFHFWYTQKK